MSPHFRSLRDPLFGVCVLLYFANRWVLKGLYTHGFFHDYLNDLICIPFWVPIMLAGMRVLGLRRDDGAPRSYEILVPLLVWSAGFELLVPQMGLFKGVAFADHVDVLFYVIGAVVGGVWWRMWYGEAVPGGAERAGVGSSEGGAGEQELARGSTVGGPRV